MGVNSAYADWQEFNYEVYNDSETLRIIAIGNAFFDPVYVKILDVDGNVVKDEAIVTDKDFEFVRNYGYSYLGGFGKYTAP